MLIILFFANFRTITNIGINDDVDDVLNGHLDLDLGVAEIDDDECDFQLNKKRKNSSNGDHVKVFESIAKSIKDNHSKKIELFEKVVNRPHSEIELFFMSISKTVEKFNPIEQTKVKIEISRIVNQLELAHFENMNKISVNSIIETNTGTILKDGETFSIEEMPIVCFHE